MPGEFDSVSEKIKEQLGVENNYSAETKVALEEAQRMAEDQQKKIMMLMEEAAIVGKKQSVKSLSHKYRIPKGTTILILKWPEAIKSDTVINSRDFKSIVTSKDVVYDAEDICMNPITGECVLDNLRRSIWYKEKNYFAFFLPKNAKKIPFILVQRFKISVQPDTHLKEIQTPNWFGQI